MFTWIQQRRTSVAVFDKTDFLVQFGIRPKLQPARLMLCFERFEREVLGDAPRTLCFSYSSVLNCVFFFRISVFLEKSVLAPGKNTAVQLLLSQKKSECEHCGLAFGLKRYKTDSVTICGLHSFQARYIITQSKKKKQKTVLVKNILGR